jgi:hypothetical protein
MHEPSTDAFAERRKNLEDAFFKDRDQHLMQKTRELGSFEESKKLAHVSGIVEEAFSRDLVEAGVRAETLTPTLIPMVEVAWCDGSVSVEEREAVLTMRPRPKSHPDTVARIVTSMAPESPRFPHCCRLERPCIGSIPPDAQGEPCQFKRNMVDRCAGRRSRWRILGVGNDLQARTPRLMNW